MKKKRDSRAGQNEEMIVGKDGHGRFKTKLGYQRAKCAHPFQQGSTKGKNGK
jgi:hypothetical protein